MEDKINKSEILKNLKADMKEAERLQREWFIKREEWSSQTEGAPYGNEVEGKSKIVSKDIKKQREWMIPSITDPFLSTSDVIKCNPVTYEDAKAARQNELLLNTQFCRKFNRYNFIMKATKVLVTEGSVVIQTGWDYEEEEVEAEVEVISVDENGMEFVDTEISMQTNVIRNQPTAVVCRNEDIFIDPTCMDDMDKCQFVIHRYESSLNALKQDGRYENLDKVEAAQYNLTNDPQYLREDQTYFEFKDKPRKKFVVHEYWGNYDIDGDGIAEPIVCAWVGNTIIRLESNPYPDNKPPFVIVPFSAVPFQMFGEALAETIGDNQKVKTAITRGMIDNMAKSNNAVVATRKGALDPVNRKKFLKGENFEFNGTPGDFWQGSYNQLPSSAFDMLNLQNNEIESQTGVKSFSGGISGNSLGNMLDIETDVPLMDGSWKKLRDVCDGDGLIGSNGKVTTVLKAHEIKYPEQAYDMKFENEAVVKSGGEHLWTVKVHGTSHKLREWTTISADDVYGYMQKGHRVTIPAMKEMHAGIVTGNSIDPYVLGYWLGDGMSHSARITTEDIEVIDNFNTAGYNCVEVKDSSKCGNAKMYDVYKIGYKPTRDSATGQFIGTGSFHSELRELGLHARYNGEKHIPKEYFTATYDEKMELIRGLMDSDGYAHSGAFVQFCQSESRLKDDVIMLIKSLGLKVSVIKRDKHARNAMKQARCNISGSKMIWARKDAYEVGFTPWSNPFKLSRKADKWKRPKIETVKLTSMEKVDKVLMRCLTVDSADKLFAVTSKFILTHNTATGARGALDATATRRLNLVRNMSENMIKPIMRKWMAYNAEFLEEEEVIRITNDEYVPIRRDDLAGKIDIDISISTSEDNAAKSQELSFLLQTVGPNEDPSIRREIMAQIMDLMRMPEQAKKIRDYQPQVDPVQQKMQELQIAKLEAEIEKIRADAANKLASSVENEADRDEKLAQAELKRAQARKLMSEADNLDMDFLRKDEMIDEQTTYERDQMQYDRKMQEKQFDRLHTLEVMQAQIDAGGKNEQIGVK